MSALDEIADIRATLRAAQDAREPGDIKNIIGEELDALWDAVEVLARAVTQD